MLHAVFQAERDSERFALYARKAALDERAEEIRQQLKVGASHGAMQGVKDVSLRAAAVKVDPAVQISMCTSAACGSTGFYQVASTHALCIQGKLSAPCDVSAVLNVTWLRLQGTLLAQFKQEAKSRMAVLHKLKHINAEGTVLLKGRAACEIDTTDELLSTGAGGCGFLLFW